MMPHRHLAVALLALLAFSCLPASAQDGQGRRGGRGLTPDRLMESDADGDGKLSRDELPERVADRIFDRADADEDGFLTEDELTKFIESRSGGRSRDRAGQGESRRGGPAGSSASFSVQMRTLGQSMRRLSRSDLTSDRSADFAAVAAIQSALIGAKSRLDTVKPSTAATKKFGDDMDAYHRALRFKLLEAMMESVNLEMALADGDTEGAKVIMRKIVAIRDAGHGLFQSDEEPDDQGKASKGNDDEDADGTDEDDDDEKAERGNRGRGRGGRDR